MAEYYKELKVGEVTYKLSFNIDRFNHLCTFRELSGVNLSKWKEDPDFSVPCRVSAPFTEMDLKIFTYMFFTKLQENGYDMIDNNLKGYLCTVATGNRSRWGYVMEQQATLLPFLKQLPIYGSAVLYSDPSEAIYRSPNTQEEPGYEELTQFNIAFKKLLNVDFDDVIKHIEAENTVVKEISEDSIVLTREAIIKYIRGNNETE